MSVAASRLVHFVMPVSLGLTPQAKCLSPLRGFTRLPHVDGVKRLWMSPFRGLAEFICLPFLGAMPQVLGYAAASRLHPMRIVLTRVRVSPLRFLARSPHVGGVKRARVSPLRFLARSPHLGGGDAHTRVVASRLRPMRIVVTRAPVSSLCGLARSPHANDGDPDCRHCDSRPAPKARQIFSLGRQPQDSGGQPIKEPQRGDRYLAWGVSPRKRCGQLRRAPKGRQTFGLGCECQDDWRNKCQEHSAICRFTWCFPPRTVFR